MIRAALRARWPRLLVSAGLLGALAVWLDVGAIAARLAALDPWWVALGLLVATVQIVLSSWRWRYTAQCLGLRLQPRRAIGEYYLASLVNQILPGGVVGDISRAWRQVRHSGDGATAVNSVVIERASGQLVMALVAFTGLLLTPEVRSGLVSATPAATLLLVVLTVVLLGGAVLVGTRRLRFARALLLDSRRALFNRLSLPVQLLSSTLVVGSYLLLFLIAARALGDPTPAMALLPLVPVVLLAMLIPVGFAGWGLREGAAAIVWTLAGLDPAQGVAIAIAYGLLVLVATLPGTIVLWREARRTQVQLSS